MITVTLTTTCGTASVTREGPIAKLVPSFRLNEAGKGLPWLVLSQSEDYVMAMKCIPDGVHTLEFTKEHDCWDNAVPYEFYDEEGKRFHGHECAECETFLHAS